MFSWVTSQTFKTLALFLVIAIVPFFVVRFYAAYSARQILTSQIERYLSFAVQSECEAVKETISNELRALRWLSESAQFALLLSSLDSPGVDTAKQLNDILNHIFERAARRVLAFVITDAQGRVVATTNMSMVENFVYYNNSGNTGWRLVDGAENARSEIFFAQEMRDQEGVVIGHLLAFYDVIEFLYINKPRKLGQTSERIIVIHDENGDAMYVHPVIGDTNAAFKRVVPKERTEFPVVQALSKKEMFFKGEDSLGMLVFASTGYIEEIGWGVVEKITVDEVMAPLRQQERLMMIVVGVYVLTVVMLSMFFSKLLFHQQKLTQITTELFRSNEELEHLAYALSHDLKAPLRTIKNYIDLLIDRYVKSPDEHVQTYVEHITSSVSSLNNMIDGLLLYARYSQSVKLERVSFKSLLDGVINNLHFDIESTGIDIILENVNIDIWCEKDKMACVVQNLILNAIKFRSPKKTKQYVKVRVERNVSRTLIFVEDNGIGIGEEYMPKMFNLFYRVNPSLEGTGIGLALCKRVIESHGGTINIKSIIDQGTTLIVSLPNNG